MLELVRLLKYLLSLLSRSTFLGLTEELSDTYRDRFLRHIIYMDGR